MSPIRPSSPAAASSVTSDWAFTIGAVLLYLVNLFLNPPEGGVVGRGAQLLIGHFIGVSVGLGLAVLLVYGVARLIRRGKRTPLLARVAFWTLLGLGALNFVYGSGRKPTDSTVLTDAERHGLLVQADSIRHAALGFAMPSPGAGFAPSPDLQARVDSTLAGHPDMVAWVLVDPDLRATLMIQLTAFAFLDERRFRDFAVALRTHVTKAEGAILLADTVTWQPPRGNFSMLVNLRAGVFLKTRCVSGDRAKGAFIVCLQTGSADSTSFDLVHDGLSLRH